MDIEHRKKVLHFLIAGTLLVLFLVYGTAVPLCHPAYKFLSSVILLLGGAVVFCYIWGNAVGRPCVMSGLHNSEAIIANHLKPIQKSSSRPLLNGGDHQ